MDKRILALTIASLFATGAMAQDPETADPATSGSGSEAIGGGTTDSMGTTGTGSDAMSSGGSTGDVSFQDLDGDQDGYITKQEAEQSESLASNWDQVDQNQDDQLDQAEFSAFMEQQGGSGMESEPGATGDTGGGMGGGTEGGTESPMGTESPSGGTSQ